MPIIFYALLILVVLSPLPFGSNIPVASNFAAFATALLTLLWAVVIFTNKKHAPRPLNPWLILLFLLPVIWAMVQVSPHVPASWAHPLWQKAGDALNEQLPGVISLTPDKTWSEIMLWLTYGLVFFLFYQFCSKQQNAAKAIKWIAAAALLYAIYGLFIHWGGFNTVLLYEKVQYEEDVTSTFINRNSYATYAGFGLLCTIALFLDKMGRHTHRIRGHLMSRKERVELFLLKLWPSLIGLLLIVTALVSTHSRGGFISTGIAVILLLIIFAVKSNYHFKPLAAAVASVIAITSVAYSISSNELLQRLDRTSSDSEERITLYENTLEAIGDYPWRGQGYGAFREAFRLYRNDETRHDYHKAHNTYLENLFGLGIPAASAMFLAIFGMVWISFLGIWRRRRNWIYPAIGFAVSIQVAIHSLVDFSLQMPAIAITYAAIMGVAVAQSKTTVARYTGKG